MAAVLGRVIRGAAPVPGGGSAPSLRGSGLSDPFEHNFSRNSRNRSRVVALPSFGVRGESWGMVPRLRCFDSEPRRRSRRRRSFGHDGGGAPMSWNHWPRVVLVAAVCALPGLSGCNDDSGRGGGARRRPQHRGRGQHQSAERRAVRARHGLRSHRHHLARRVRGHRRILRRCEQESRRFRRQRRFDRRGDQSHRAQRHRRHSRRRPARLKGRASSIADIWHHEAPTGFSRSDLLSPPPPEGEGRQSGRNAEPR